MEGPFHPSTRSLSSRRSRTVEREVRRFARCYPIWVASGETLTQLVNRGVHDVEYASEVRRILGG